MWRSAAATALAPMLADPARGRRLFWQLPLPREPKDGWGRTDKEGNMLTSNHPLLLPRIVETEEQNLQAMSRRRERWNCIYPLRSTSARISPLLPSSPNCSGRSLS